MVSQKENHHRTITPQKRNHSHTPDMAISKESTAPNEAPHGIRSRQTDGRVEDGHHVARLGVCDNSAPFLTSVRGPCEGDSDLQTSVRGPCQRGSNSCEPACDACSFCEDTCDNPLCAACVRKSEESDTLSTVGAPPGKALPSNGLFGLPGRDCAGSASSVSEKKYTMCQLKRHNKTESAWLLVGDTIYDATSYVGRHPGGARSIVRKSGGVVDCTEDMRFHSKKAIKVWKKNKIGKLCRCPCEVNSGDERDSHCEDVADQQCTIS